ncbi:hypothetical protein IQ26_05733 [Mesorhizobium tianshanense]|uniref:Uncharacterized protein n=1 Tax=Mesorhizobium tianshanense TaxID=39844 RepID=A0A562N426_9HYPH|nr:hypothetical protein IQ26_05733 [Mesorhizobium tianshanense]
MAAKRPEGVGPTGLGPLSQTQEVGAPRETTPSVAFGDISSSRGEITCPLLSNLHDFEMRLKH